MCRAQKHGIAQKVSHNPNVEKVPVDLICLGFAKRTMTFHLHVPERTLCMFCYKYAAAMSSSIVS